MSWLYFLIFEMFFRDVLETIMASCVEIRIIPKWLIPAHQINRTVILQQKWIFGSGITQSTWQWWGVGLHNRKNRKKLDILWKSCFNSLFIRWNRAVMVGLDSFKICSSCVSNWLGCQLGWAVDSRLKHVVQPSIGGSSWDHCFFMLPYSVVLRVMHLEIFPQLFPYYSLSISYFVVCLMIWFCVSCQSADSRVLHQGHQLSSLTLIV